MILTMVRLPAAMVLVLQVTTLPVWLQMTPRWELIFETVNSAGRVSVMVTLVAVPGPRFFAVTT